MSIITRWLVLALGLSTAPLFAAEATRLDYEVWLDDRQIGHYTVNILPRGLQTEVSIDTDIEWTFLSIPMYRYQHRNTEVWQDGCLLTLESETQDNGKRNFVSARSEGDQFKLSSHQGGLLLEGCVRSFAYWNPALLSTDQLLNSQTGEYTNISITPLLDDRPISSWGDTAVTGYRLSLPDTSIDLWYSSEMEWLLLQTRVRGGKLLSYVRTGGSA